MDQLPLEILNRIFIQLPFSQKKECMFVCRLWENAIKTQWLFHTLEISDEGRYHEFMDIMKQTPSFRKQVVDLAVQEYWDSQDIKDFIEYFPNLAHFSNTAEPFVEQDDVDSNSEIAGSDGRVRSLQDSDSCTLLRGLSEAGLCSLINELYVDYFNPDQLCPVLKNMPVLKRVSLQYTYITIAQLEMLHQNIPSIDYLAVDLAPFNGLVPTVITPAASISLVYVQMEYVVEDDQISWLLYASKKYPNLKEYYIEIENRNYEEEDMEAFRNIYSVGYNPLFESLGPRLMSIYLLGAEFGNFEIFYRMDEHRCQIKNVVLFSNQDNTWRSALSHSNQARHIETLAIYSVRTCTFDWAKHLEVLKALTISFKVDDFEGSDEVDISMLLNSCSKTVKSIGINYRKCCFSGELDCSFQLEELRLDYGQAPANIDQFISNCLPNLRVLSLDGSMDSNANLILPKHHFSDVRLYLNEAGEYSNFLVKTMDDNKCFLFKTKNKQPQVFVSFRDEPIKPLDEDDFNGELFIELVFGSVGKLIINNYKAILD